MPISLNSLSMIVWFTTSNDNSWSIKSPPGTKSDVKANSLIFAGHSGILEIGGKGICTAGLPRLCVSTMKSLRKLAVMNN